MAQSHQDRLDKRRKKGPSAYEKSRGPNTGAWEKIIGGMTRPSQEADWNRGYNGPGKGTW